MGEPPSIAGTPSLSLGHQTLPTDPHCIHTSVRGDSFLIEDEKTKVLAVWFLSSDGVSYQQIEGITWCLGSYRERHFSSGNPGSTSAQPVP